jgi:hypothetical protein
VRRSGPPLGRPGQEPVLGAPRGPRPLFIRPGLQSPRPCTAAERPSEWWRSPPRPLLVWIRGNPNPHPNPILSGRRLRPAGAARMMMEKQAQEGQQAAAAGVVHSQVRRIKQEEDEKVKVHETYQHHVAEMRLVLRRDLARQRSRSPLGRAGRPGAISIGGDS